jgi:CRP-like cAMP-binding protein
MKEFDTIDDHFASYARLLTDDASARFNALRNCSFFRPVPDESLQRFSQMAQIRSFASDFCLTSQDDDMKAFYVILYGAAEAFRNGKLVGTIETGDCFRRRDLFYGRDHQHVGHSHCRRQDHRCRIQPDRDRSAACRPLMRWSA